MDDGSGDKSAENHQHYNAADVNSREVDTVPHTLPGVKVSAS